MTTPLSATVANLRRLLDDPNTTKRPWQATFDGGRYNDGVVFWEGDKGAWRVGPAILDGKDGPDAHLAVAAVNALPSLLDAVEERDRLREAVETVLATVDIDGRGWGEGWALASQGELIRLTVGMYAALRAALTEVDPHA
jgi:hypothetical protein